MDAFAVYTTDGSLVMDNAVLTASGGGTSIGVSQAGTSSTMTNVKISATGTGGNRGVSILYPSVVTMSNVTVTAKNGSVNYGMTGADYTGSIDRSTFEGATNSIALDPGWPGSPFTLRIGASKLAGGVSGGILTCVASYDGNYAPLGANCQ